MNYPSNTPYGIDYYITNAQNRMYSHLCPLWGVNDSSYNCFGRAYRNKYDNKGYIAETFFNNQYLAGNGISNAGGLGFEDGIAVVSWFSLNETKQIRTFDYEANCSLYMFLNLNKIKPGSITDNQGQRLDEVAISDVVNWFNVTKASGFNVTGYVRDIDKILERYSGSYKLSMLNKNMQPYLAFRVDMLLAYNPILNQPVNI